MRQLRPDIRNEGLVALLLAALTLIAYEGVFTHQFVNYDDDVYVTDNPHVQAGLTRQGIGWAFSAIASEQRTYFHPLTWLSHMLDCELFGLNPGPQHAMNLGFHIVNVVLLFLLLRRMTGTLWPGAVTAAFFALHPLQVDTVAWVAERKNVLSTFFWLATLLAYVHYARRPGALRYLGVFALFALGLMAKPMLVTLPCVMLLLDYWPLRRLRAGTWAAAEQGVTQVFPPAPTRRLIVEKIPLLALSAISAAITIIAHQRLGLMVSAEQLAPTYRISLVFVSYSTYLLKTFWPVDLAVYYPLPSGWSVVTIALAFATLAVLSVLAVMWSRKRPYLLVGWLWFLGTLVPVIGVLQVSDQAMADRWIYVPLIGLLIMVVWGLRDCLSAWRQGEVMVWSGLFAALAVCAWLTHEQVRYWQNSETLFRHALAVTRDNYLANLNLGAAIAERRALAEATAHFDEAIRLRPNSPQAHYDRANVFALEGRYDDAIREYDAALKLKPAYADVHFNLGNVLAMRKRYAEAKPHFLEAIKLRRDYADAHAHLGNLLFLEGDLEGATIQLRTALATKPNAPETRCLLGKVLAAQRQYDAAKEQFVAALSLQADYDEVEEALGNVLLLQNQVDEAMPHLRRAAELQPARAPYQYRLANVLARQKEFQQAVSCLRAAVLADPNYASALNDLAWILATSRDQQIRNPEEAVGLARRACQITGDADPGYLDTLAVAQAETGRFDDAIALTERAIALANASGNSASAADLQGRLRLYRAKHSYTQDRAPALETTQ